MKSKEDLNYEIDVCDGQIELLSKALNRWKEAKEKAVDELCEIHLKEKIKRLAKANLAKKRKLRHTPDATCDNCSGTGWPNFIAYMRWKTPLEMCKVCKGTGKVKRSRY